MAIILHHPAHQARLEPYPPDPRDPTVRWRDDICTPCGQPRDAHYDNENLKHGCEYALRSVAVARAAGGLLCDVCGRGLGTQTIALQGAGVFCSSRCATTGSLRHAAAMQR